jgi:LysM repeat protein
LYSISKKFNISVSKLVEINNIKNNNLSIGQSLKVIKK